MSVRTVSVRRPPRDQKRLHPLAPAGATRESSVPAHFRLLECSMAKALVIDYEKCDGCKKCEVACSRKHTGTDGPAVSRIRVLGWEPDGMFMPVVCHQCEDPPCIAACPTMSRSRDEETGQTTVDYDRCIACKTCVAVCPFGATRYDPISKRIVTCDLCGGDPECVKVCETGAIRCVEKADLNQMSQLEAAMKLRRATEPAYRIRESH